MARRGVAAGTPVGDLCGVITGEASVPAGDLAARGPTPDPSRKREGGKAALKPRGKRKVRVQVRWSQKREEVFLATLAETSNVAASIRASGLSETNVYRRRRQNEEFRAKWATALREGYLKLESTVLARALNGVEKPIFHGGAQIATVTEYNDRTALALLTLHRETVTGSRDMAADMPVEQIRERLAKRLEAMNLRLGGEG